LVEKLAWLVPALPLVAWAVLLLVGKRLPGGGAAVGILAVAIGWVISLAILFGIIGGADAYHVSREWAPIGAPSTSPSA
jgi:NADH:ubiquinone oxidoreductase subunit 5 (subunit L)/multisubunit Na+/H+ antiporter MnhA subunit